MGKMDMDDIMFDALFERVVKDQYIAEIDSIPPKEELAKLYPLSPQFDLRMKKAFARYHRKGIFAKIIKQTQRVAVVLLIITTAFFGLLLTNPEVRAAVGNVVVEWFEKFTSITFSNNESNAEIKELRVKYLPDGYSLTSMDDMVNLALIIYSDDSGNQIKFMYQPGNNASNISIDNEHHIIENYSMNGHDAFLAISENNNFDNGIIFVYESNIVEIWGKIPIDELIKMAESVEAERIE